MGFAAFRAGALVVRVGEAEGVAEGYVYWRSRREGRPLEIQRQATFTVQVIPRKKRRAVPRPTCSQAL
jgi:hypothetical protein